MVLDPALTSSNALYVATQSAVYGSSTSLSGFESSLLAPTGLPTFSGGLGFTSISGEQQLYVPIGQNRVAVFAIGACGHLECANLLAQWTGERIVPTGSFTKEEGQIETGGLIADLAVDASSSETDWAKGDVFVATATTFFGHDQGLNVIDVFQPMTGGGEDYVTQLTGTPEGPFESPEKIVVSGSTGDVFVVDRRGSVRVIDVFKPVVSAGGEKEYEFIERITPPQGAFRSRVGALAVDGGIDGKPEDGDIYATEEINEAAGKQESVIDEFNEEGQFIGSFPGGGANDLQVVGAAAVDPESHDIFVGDDRESEPRAVIDVFSANETTPEVRPEPASEFELQRGSQSWKVQFNGSVNPEKAGGATCAFVWGLAGNFDHTKSCEGLGSATNPLDGSLDEYVVVHASVGGLESDTTYSYRLQATNPQGTDLSEKAVAFVTPGPGVHGESMSDVSSSSATLDATVDPNGRPTSYRFEYDTSAFASNAAGHGVSVPVDDQSIGSGHGDVDVGQHVQGLVPNTEYHYRLVIVSEVTPGVSEEFDAPDKTFRTEPEASRSVMLDRRVWELVSPPNKHGASIFGLVKPFNAFLDAVQSSPNGRAVAYTAFAPTEVAPAGFSSAEEVISQRSDKAGWSSRDVSPSHAAPTGLESGPEYPLFSEDLSSGLVDLSGFDKDPLSPWASEETPYMRDVDCEPAVSECYAPLVTSTLGPYQDVTNGVEFGGKVSFVGASPDMRHIVLASEAALTGDAETEGHEELYEWSRGEGVSRNLRLVSIMPENEGGGPVTGLVSAGLAVSGLRSVSDDGSRVLWVTRTKASESNLYMRDFAQNKTIRLNVVQPGGAGGTPGAMFEGASADGSVVFFSDTERLTADSSQAGSDLYRCMIVEDQCVLTDLTPESTTGSSEVQNLILGSSADGSYVYFVANGLLEGAEVPRGTARGGCTFDVGSPTTCNLYIWHNGRTKFIAELSGEDELDWGSDNTVPGAHLLGHLTARVSENGESAVFMSAMSLTGYDNQDIHSGKRDFEVFLFNAATEKLVCVSCDPSGARPAGVEAVSATAGGNLAAIAGHFGTLYGNGSWVAANIPGGTMIDGFGMSLRLSHVLFDDGRVFFNSSDGLVPQDVNGQEDVYEYEPVGVGDCTTASELYEGLENGCVGLVSSGTASGESGFLEASDGGSDVFFLTGGRLVGEDVDTAVDVYDAHVCQAGETCGEHQTARGACATAEACRAPVSPQPLIFGPSPSATLDGPSREVPGTAGGAKHSNAGSLTKALRVCRRDRSRSRRVACERRAWRRFGSAGAGRRLHGQGRGGKRKHGGHGKRIGG